MLLHEAPALFAQRWVQVGPHAPHLGQPVHPHVRWARAHGAHGEAVERTEDFAPALDRALVSGKAALIELRTDPNIITTRTTLATIRAKALVDKV